MIKLDPLALAIQLTIAGGALFLPSDPPWLRKVAYGVLLLAAVFAAVWLLDVLAPGIERAARWWQRWRP